MQEYFNISLEEYTMEEISALCGPKDAYVDLLCREFQTSFVMRGNELKIRKIDAESEGMVRLVVARLLELVAAQRNISERDVIYLCKLARIGQLERFDVHQTKAIGRTAQGKAIYPKTLGQRYLCQCMERNDIVFATGVAGTGKTYLAVAYAVNMLKRGDVQKIILTRPAVEAGESLGFLPGDLKEKVDPYLRPLYDALFDMLGAESYARLVERGSIEVAPLAYMRGRTLDDSFIILDEAQNTTCEQMKMFLTRLGFNSKMVITGDITQIDLPDGRRSGLKDAMRVLRNVDDISVFRFTEKDVVRHRLVQDIIRAYEKASAAK